MNQPPQPSHSPAAAEATRTPWLRFSLLTLLCVTTLTGFVSAIVFSAHWHADERLLLAFWCAGLILGVSFGKARGSRGVLSGALGGAVGCVLAAMIVLHRFEEVPEGAARYTTVYLVFVVTIGSLSALAVAGGYQFVSSGAIERTWHSKRARVISLLLLGSVVTGLIVWQLLRPKPWQPSWELKLQADLTNFPKLRLSPTGQFLFAEQSNYRTFPSEHKGNVYQLRPRGLISRPSTLKGAPSSFVLSPDGRWLAESSIASGGLGIYDNTSEREPPFWEWQVEAEAAVFLQFNPASDRLLITTNTPRIQRLYVVDPARKELPQPELFPFAGRLMLDPTGEVLIKLHDAAEDNGLRKVEVVRRRDGQLLGEMHDVPDLILDRHYVVSPGGEYIASGQEGFGIPPRVWKLNAKSSTAMPGMVLAFTGDGRAIVHVNWKRQAAPEWLPNWLLPMPLVRHAYDLKSPLGQLLLIDLATGETQTASAPFKHMLLAQAADQGNVVLGVTYPDAHVRIWQVPPRQREK